MHRTLRGVAWLGVCCLLLLGNLGCLKKILLDGTVASTRKGSAALNTVGDWDMAYRAASAGLAQFEGYHYLAPDNEDALFLLTKGWAGYGFGFIEDEMERAEDLHGDTSEHYEYQKARAVAAYSRAVFYGTTLLEMRNPGFEDAKRNAKSIRAWLNEFDDPEVDVPILFWTAQAWLAKINLLKDDPENVAELFIGAALITRVVELDETYLYGSPLVIMGSYHARSTMAELEDSKKAFERALQISGGKALMAKLQYAVKYYCAKVDKDNYARLLNEVLEAGDVLPEQRLQNTIAKRKAKRALQEERMDRCGFD